MNLHFETGEVEVKINDDPTRVIKFNPTDLSFVERFENTYKKAEDLVKKYDRQFKEAKIVDTKNKNKNMEAKVLKESNKDARNLVDTLFDDNVADVIFGRIHPLSYTSNHKTILENFLMALTQYIQASTENVLAEEKEMIDKYKAEYDRYTS